MCNFHTYEWLQPDMVTTCMPVVCSTFLSNFTPNFKCSPQQPPLYARYGNHHHHHHHHISFMEFGHLLACSGLTYPEVSFRETFQSLKFPLNGLPAQSRLSPVVGLLPLASGPACLGMIFPPFLL